MLDQLFDSIGGEVVGKLTEKTGLNLDQAKAMLPLAQESVSEGVMKQVTDGNIGGLVSMLGAAQGGGGGGLMDNPIFSSIKGALMGKVMEKMGLPSQLAGMASGVGLESIMGLIGNKVSDDDGNIDEGNIVSQLGLGDSAVDMAKNVLKSKLGGLGGLLG
ncbi:MAG: hypothetical protein AB8G22_04950 [Saprospiraceae bacterium]